MFDSNIRFISRAIVAANKPGDTDRVSVWPLEIITEISDEITDETEEVSVTGIDSDNNDYTVTLVRGACIVAEWGGCTNRSTSPNVRRGERVDLYQVGDSQKYYWVSSGLDDNLRRMEAVVYTFNANPKNEDAIPDETNTYTLEINAPEGHVTLRTSDANGEAARYTAQFNTKEGVFTVEDNLGNHIYMDSPNADIEIRNSEESYIQLVGDVINLETVTLNMKCDTLNVDVAKTMTVNAGELKINVEGDSSISTKTFSLDVEEAASITANSFNLTANDTSLTLGDTTIEAGDVTYSASDTKIAGTVSFSDEVTFKAGLTSEAASSFTAATTFTTISGQTASFPLGSVGP